MSRYWQGLLSLKRRDLYISKFYWREYTASRTHARENLSGNYAMYSSNTAWLRLKKWCNTPIKRTRPKSHHVPYCSHTSLLWRHNECAGVSNHQRHDCLLNRLFRRRSKKTSKLCFTGLCGGIPRWTLNSPQKWPVTRKMFPFDDVIMFHTYLQKICSYSLFTPDGKLWS